MQSESERATEGAHDDVCVSGSPEWALWIAAGATLGLLGVAIGAAATHALQGRIDTDSLDTLETAVRFQMYHAIALLALGALGRVWRSRVITLSGALLVFGTIVFCGSLYLLALLDIGLFGAVAPVGGASLMAGWCVLAVGAARDYLRNRNGGTR